jgi:hypothetical protein
MNSPWKNTILAAAFGGVCGLLPAGLLLVAIAVISPWIYAIGDDSKLTAYRAAQFLSASFALTPFYYGIKYDVHIAFYLITVLFLGLLIILSYLAHRYAMKPVIESLN